ncbi:M20 family metallopeptidase [Peribacillus sp. NPDC006672]|uniref:M20 family metallopeptidase n=1 Tax=Peribacillus sp. NPDC006672 TaxID=3390606 RepID=UPI003CFFA8E0
MLMEKVIAWRRHLHKYPELSFQEYETAAFVEKQLKQHRDLLVFRPTPTSVMARFVSEKPGKVVALRADMDSLPIQEETNLPFKSERSGVMHACGHDGHTAILLGVAEYLVTNRHEIQGEIRFLFQHAEELAPGGAQEMVNAGVMDGVDYVIGLHLWSTLEYGKVGILYGNTMAAPDIFEIEIEGKGGHAAFPHETIDPIVVGAQVVTNSQQIISRRTDPLDPVVLSITQFHAGTTFNVIPDKVSMSGTVRSFDPRYRQFVHEQMDKLVRGIVSGYDASYTLEYNEGYLPVVNHVGTTKIVEEAAVELFGTECIEKMKPVMGAEDFSAFQQKAPGTFVFVGAGNKDKGITKPHHHPQFDIDENSLNMGVKLMVRSAQKLTRTEI